MNNCYGKDENIPDIVKRIPLENLIRIDVALEGNWNPTVTTVWTKEDGFIGFSKVKKSHEKFKPSIELYFKDFWVGIHCFERTGNKNVFDEKLATGIINFVDNALNGKYIFQSPWSLLTMIKLVSRAFHLQYTTPYSLESF